MKKKLAAIFALVCTVCCAIGLTACDTNEGNVEITDITLDNTAITLTEGEGATLKATITPANATNKSLYWSSTNESIATVENGNVLAIAAGETTIRVESNNGISATCAVTVKAANEDPDTPVQYDVTFDANGGKFENDEVTYVVQVDNGKKLTDNVTVARGDKYFFTGWYVNEARTELWDFENDTVIDDTYLYAGWKYLNSYQSVIDALAARIKTERQDNAIDVEILSVFTDNGYLCFIEKDSAGVFSYSTDINGFDEIIGNAELISQISDSTLSKIKDYNYTYKLDAHAYIAENMVLKFASASTVIYSCVSEWENDNVHINNGGTYYSCNIKAVVADENDRVFDYSVTVVSGIADFDIVIGSAMSETFDENMTQLGEVANDFYSEYLMEKAA